MTDLSNRKPILCLDFDGVCHSYTSGWKGAAVIPDPPVPGMWEFLFEASRHFELSVFSSRSHQPGGMDAMKEWFVKWFVHHENVVAGCRKMDVAHATPIVTTLLRFPLEKPPAQITIDDRGILFTGEWPSLETLKTFKPWYQKDKAAYL